MAARRRGAEDRARVWARGDRFDLRPSRAGALPPPGPEPPEPPSTRRSRARTPSGVGSPPARSPSRAGDGTPPEDHPPRRGIVRAMTGRAYPIHVAPSSSGRRGPRASNSTARMPGSVHGRPIVPLHRWCTSATVPGSARIRRGSRTPPRFRGRRGALPGGGFAARSTPRNGGRGGGSRSKPTRPGPVVWRTKSVRGPYPTDALVDVGDRRDYGK